MNFADSVKPEEKVQLKMQLKKYIEKGYIPREGKKYTEAKEILQMLQ